MTLVLQACSGTAVQQPRRVVIHQTENSPGMMQGFPPPPEKLVSIDNWTNEPYSSWSFFNVSKLIPTDSISRGTRPVRPLSRWTKNINLITFDDRDGNLMSVGQMLNATYTNGFIVLKDGKIINEQYFNGMGPASRHIIWSCSQAMLGSIIGVFVQNGLLDPDARVESYIPELTGSGFADATLQQVLDMQVALDYSEDFRATTSPNVNQLYRSAGFGQPQAPEEQTIYDFLKTIGKKGEHGAVFQFATPNTEVLGWILEKVTGKSLIEVLAHRMWRQIGAERDAISVVNRAGNASPGGGFNLTLRDFARFGLVHHYDGRFNSRQIVPDAWIQDIRRNGDKQVFKKSPAAAIFPEGSYRNQWWVTGNRFGSYLAMGIHGQFLYISPRAKVVIAKLSSHPKPEDPELMFITLSAFEAISSTLEKI